MYRRDLLESRALDLLLQRRLYLHSIVEDFVASQLLHDYDFLSILKKIYFLTYSQPIIYHV